MATVQNVYDLFRAMLPKPRANLKEEHILAALNEGAHEAWKVLSTFEGEQNWFVSIDTGNTIAVNDLDIALPSGCASLKKIEVTAPASHQTTRFYKVPKHDDQFTSLRQTPNAKATEIPYTIIGADPGTLILGCSPEVALTVSFWMVSYPTAWATLATNIDEFPRIAWAAIARYATNLIMGGTGSQLAARMAMELERELVRMTQTAERDDTGPQVVSGWLE